MKILRRFWSAGNPYSYHLVELCASRVVPTEEATRKNPEKDADLEPFAPYGRSNGPIIYSEQAVERLHATSKSTASGTSRSSAVKFWHKTEGPANLCPL